MTLANRARAPLAVALAVLAPALAAGAPIETVRLGQGFDARALSRALPALAALPPAQAALISRSALALLAHSEVVAARDADHLVLIPLRPGTARHAAVFPWKQAPAPRLIDAAGAFARHLQSFVEAKDEASAAESLRKAFDAMRAPKPMPFPSLAGMMAESLGITRPPRPPLEPLPPLPDPDSLPRRVLGTLMMAMGNRQNWGDVSYAASNITTIEGKVRAQWMYEDCKADVREYLAQLSPRQVEIAEAAFRGGMAETPPLRDEPEAVTLAWVLKRFPARR